MSGNVLDIFIRIHVVNSLKSMVNFFFFFSPLFWNLLQVASLHVIVFILPCCICKEKHFSCKKVFAHNRWLINARTLQISIIIHIYHVSTTTYVFYIFTLSPSYILIQGLSLWRASLIIRTFDFKGHNIFVFCVYIFKDILSI